MTNKKSRSNKSNPDKAKETKQLDEATEDQKPGFPNIDFKKNLGCG